MTPIGSETEQREAPQQDAPHPPHPLTAIFECPRCQKVEPNTCKVFQYNDLDKKQTCARCHKSSNIRSWKCCCGTEWQRCAIHRYSTLLEKAPNVNKPAEGQSHSDLATSQRKRKASTPLLTYDEILAEEISMDDRKLDRMSQDHATSVIPLGERKHKSVRINFLGPTLRTRFYGGRQSP